MAARARQSPLQRAPETTRALVPVSGRKQDGAKAAGRRGAERAYARADLLLPTLDVDLLGAQRVGESLPDRFDFIRTDLMTGTPNGWIHA